eukprot:scaffold1624_cov403-Prasinococcus_capsulatus_cf.AAC.5
MDWIRVARVGAGLENGMEWTVGVDWAGLVRVSDARRLGLGVGGRGRDVRWLKGWDAGVSRGRAACGRGLRHLSAGCCRSARSRRRYARSTLSRKHALRAGWDDVDDDDAGVHIAREPRYAGQSARALRGNR